jgi:ABC-type nitrate/sulfonate/bicarbonate transport system substrate-binding protein
MKNNYALIIGAMLALACVAGSGCISSDGGDADIRYGGQYYPEEFVLDGDPSIWAMFGVTVDHTLFSSGAEGNEALIAGRVDINVGSDSKTIALFNAIPDDAVIIGTTQRGNRYTTIIPIDSDVTSWDDLVGKTVAIRLGTGAESILRKYFEESGYVWEEYNWVNMKIEDMTAALEGGQIAAFTAWEPIPGIAEAQGVGKVMRTYGDVSLVPVSIHTTQGFIESNRDDIVKFLAAQLYKAELIRVNPQKAAQIASQSAAARGIEVSPEAFITIFERIDFSIAFDEDIIASIDETAQFLYEEGKINELPTLVWDTSLVAEAQALLDSMNVSYE